MNEPLPEPRDIYSPHYRTAVVLSGTGTGGAYHAGVLRALDEAGVKVDLVAGRGAGAVGAVFAAIAGGSKLWEARGLWRSREVAALYGWRAALGLAAWPLLGAVTVMFFPLAFLVSGLLVYPLGFLISLVRPDTGGALIESYARSVDVAFQPEMLPTLLPRVMVLMLAAFIVVLAVGGMLGRSGRRRRKGAFWWRLLGAPVAATRAVRYFRAGLWQLMRGGARVKQPSPMDLSRRYAELLRENLGQPGFRELLLTAYDLDARRDLVFALLGDTQRRSFFLKKGGAGGERRAAEAFDLAGVGRDHALDALAGALCLPVAAEPHFVSFAPDSYWRGETHRLCDRPEAIGRLLEEVAVAGVDQVIVVSAAGELQGPHTLSTPREDARSRLGEYLAATESASVRDAIAARGGQFRRLFQIHPVHNPVGPLDFDGSYDERSDRRLTLGELIDRGYEDAYRQFIEPVVAVSGEKLEVQSD